MMRLWPFSKKPLIDPTMAQWQVRNFGWLIDKLGQQTRFSNRSLVIPDAQTFRTGGYTGHDLAEHVLAQVQKHAGLSKLRITLVADGEIPDYQGENVARPVHPGSAAGTYQRDDRGQHIISYDPNLLKAPEKLIAVLAHELSHAALDVHDSELPFEDELEMEYLTDLTGVFLGYGTFLSNSSFEYQQFQDGNMSGWAYNRLGYLPQTDLIHATALFSILRDVPDEQVFKHLRSGLTKTFQRAKQDISESGLLQQLQS
jgi:hypothetical protein